MGDLIMTTTAFTLIENGQSHTIEATTGDSPLRLTAEPLLDVLGWTHKPEGLCQGDVCIPLGDRPDLIDQQGIDLLGLGEALGRPVAVDREESVASMGAATAAHASQLAGGIAPEFTLPDLSGQEFSLSSFRGKKVLLIAYASW